MLITNDHPDFYKTIIILNGKWVRGAIAANDTEGWVEVPDIASMAPIDIHEKIDNKNNEVSKWEEMKTKKLTGKVEFKVIPYKETS